MSARASGVAAVYAAALLQGLTLVSFPASSAVLRAMHGFSDAQYGAIFLPQVALAVVGSLVGGAIAARVGLRWLLIAAMLANAASQAALAATSGLPAEAAYLAVLAGTGTMGFGFGLLGAPMNSYPPLLFPARRESAVVAVHTLVGIGLTVGPVLCNAAQGQGVWVGFPVGLAILAVALAGLGLVASLPRESNVGNDASSLAMQTGHPARNPVFWTFIGIGVLYAFAEGTFSNWIVVYLQDGKHLGASVAALALSAFWGALVAGRLLISALVARVPAERIWVRLPVMMTLVMLALPLASSALLGVGLFALAGLACSAFFPLSIALASDRFRQHVAWVSSMMIAALMVGVGLGSFLIGALRQHLAFEPLFHLSALYPAAVLGLALALVRRGGVNRPVALNA